MGVRVLWILFGLLTVVATIAVSDRIRLHQLADLCSTRSEQDLTQLARSAVVADLSERFAGKGIGVGKVPYEAVVMSGRSLEEVASFTFQLRSPGRERFGTGWVTPECLVHVEYATKFTPHV